MSEESLKTLKHQCRSMAKKCEYYGDADDTELFNLVDKLEEMMIRVDLKIEKKKELDRKQRQLPRGQLKLGMET